MASAEKDKSMLPWIFIALVFALFVLGGFGMGGYGMMGFGFILMLLFWVLIIWLIISLFSEGCSDQYERDAAGILKTRYAKGEINKKQFLKMKKYTGRS